MIFTGTSVAALIWVAPATAAPVEPAIPPVWDLMAACESDRTWDIDAYHDGGLQFLPSTWSAFAPAGFPAHAYDATPSQQVEVAERVLEVQGWEAWPTCARKLGLIGGGS